MTDEGGNILFKRKKQKLAPGEMERITLKAEALRKVSGGITVGLADKV